MSTNRGIFSKAKKRLLKGEEGKVIFSPTLESVVKRVTKKPITSSILNFVGELSNQDPDMLMYIEKKRLVGVEKGKYDGLHIDFNVWDKDVRERISYQGKIRRVLSKTSLNQEQREGIAKEYYKKQKEVEGMSVTSNIVNAYKHEESIGRTGTIAKSCMRNKIYTKFYENIGLSILVLKDRKGLIIGRALLWNNVYILGKKYNLVDRIYTDNHKDIELFKEWAKKNDYIYKYKQSYSQKVSFVINENTVYDSGAYVELSKSISSYNTDGYPYLDTFTYTGSIGDKKMFVDNQNGNSIAFTGLDGSYCSDEEEDDDDEDSVWCDACNDYHHIDELNYSDRLDTHICCVHPYYTVHDVNVARAINGLYYLSSELDHFVDESGSTHYVPSDDQSQTIDGYDVIYCNHCEEFHLYQDLQYVNVDGHDEPICLENSDYTTDGSRVYDVDGVYTTVEPTEEEEEEEEEEERTKTDSFNDDLPF